MHDEDQTDPGQPPAPDGSSDDAQVPDRPRRAPHRDLALVRGFRPALRILRDWVRRPLPVVVPWFVVSFGVALVLLGLVWLVASHVAADPTRPWGLPGRMARNPLAAMQHVFERNVVVLALHATACLAGFIISFATSESTGDGRLERATRVTAKVALWFVPVATLLSIGTQAWVLGSYASTASAHLHMGVATLLATTLPHALLELTAVFLPLAAWLVALRRRRLTELYAATIASVVIALPMLVGASWIEVHRWPDRVQAAPLDAPKLEGVSVGTLVSSDLDEPPVELVLGAPATRRQYPDELDAVRAADERSRDSAAIAVVQLGTRHVLHQLLRREADDVCGSTSAGELQPASLDELDELRFVRVSRTLPGSVVELDVEVLVDDGEVIVPDSWTAPSILQSIVQDRCDD